MALYLAQHGISRSKEEDPEQSLSEQGIADTKKMAETAAAYRIQVSAVRHSGKKRALETARIFASFLTASSDVQPIEGIKPLDDVEAFAQTIDPHGNIMIVGHLPFMEKLTSRLTAGSIDGRVFKFQNSGIVCLEKESDREGWHIKWALMPNVG